MEPKPRRGLAILALSISILISGCELFNLLFPGGNGDGDGEPSDVPGAVLVAWKDFIYVLGGRDSGGVYRSESWMARLGDDGLPGSWKRTVDLPEGIAFASGIAFGNFMYLIGGESGSGRVDGTLYAMTVADESSPAYGELAGFATGWQNSPSKLTAGLSRAGALIDDGRILLAGGTTANGPVATVTLGRIRKDGSVGAWYESPEALPAARSDAGAALRDGRIWLAGGMDSDKVLADTISCAWGPFFNGAFRGEAPMLAPRAFPILISASEGLLLFGGRDAGGARADGERLPDGGAWSDMSADPGYGFGPSCATVNGRVYFAIRINGASPPTIGRYGLSNPPGDSPSVFPGSGWVESGLKPAAWAYPGLELRYTAGTPASPPGSPTADSPLWDKASPPTVSADTVFKFRAFRPGSSEGASAEVMRSYRVRAGSLFPIIQATISPAVAPSALTTRVLEERYTDGTVLPVSSVWIGISIAARGIHELSWGDSFDDAEAYTAGVKVSLFEDDFYAIVHDRSNLEIEERTGGIAHPLLVELAPGSYNLRVETRDGTAGGSFGLAVTRQ